MGGLGLMGRRRAISSSPTKTKSSVKIYNRLVVKSGAYFITDYYPSNYDRISWRMATESVGTCFGARKGMGVIVLTQTGNKAYVAWDADTASQVSMTTNSPVEREMGMSYDGGYKATYKTIDSASATTIKNYSDTPTEKISQVPLYICASLVLNSDFGIDTRYFQGNFYGLKVIDSRTSELKHDFVPATSSEAVGIYDRVNRVFYYNSGTGEVTADNEE